MIPSRQIRATLKYLGKSIEDFFVQFNYITYNIYEENYISIFIDNKIVYYEKILDQNKWKLNFISRKEARELIHKSDRLSNFK